jgi:hypothetical protein
MEPILSLGCTRFGKLSDTPSNAARNAGVGIVSNKRGRPLLTQEMLNYLRAPAHMDWGIEGTKIFRRDADREAFFLNQEPYARKGISGQRRRRGFGG